VKSAIFLTKILLLITAIPAPDSHIFAKAKPVATAPAETAPVLLISVPKSGTHLLEKLFKLITKKQY